MCSNKLNHYSNDIKSQDCVCVNVFLPVYVFLYHVYLLAFPVSTLILIFYCCILLLLLLSHFSRVRLCVTP